MNEITIRPARPRDVRPALALAIRVYMLYSAPLYSPEAVDYFPNKCRDEERIREFMDGKQLMFIAWDGYKLVGMAAQRGEDVSHLYVDPDYHRRGIATKLMDRLIAAMGAPKVTLGSSPHGVPFYREYGFVPTDKEQHKHGAIWTPMEYTPAFVIRPARPEEIAPALDLAQRIFQEFIRPGENTAASYDAAHERMFVAVAGGRIVGMASQRGGCHIRKLYVDGAYHRRGIATGLLDAILQTMESTRVTVNASAYAMRFYLRYGFTQAGKAQDHGAGFITTLMAFDKGA